MKYRTFAALVVTGLVASACASSQEVRQARETHDNAICLSYGAQPGSSAYVNCRTSLAAQRRAQQDAAFDSLIVAGSRMMAQPQAPASSTRFIDCSPTTGGSSSVTCW
jgi:hypothetical protein